MLRFYFSWRKLQTAFALIKNLFLNVLLVRDCLLETVLRFWQSSSLLQQKIFYDLQRNHQSLLYLDDIIVCRWAKSGIQDRIAVVKLFIKAWLWQLKLIQISVAAIPPFMSLQICFAAVLALAPVCVGSGLVLLG